MSLVGENGKKLKWSEMRGWVGWDRGRQDTGEEGQKRKNIDGEKISASSSSREEGRQLFTDWWYSRVVANPRGGGRDKFQVQLLRFNRCGVRCNRDVMVGL